MAKSKHPNRSAAAKNREGRNKRRERAAPLNDWQKTLATKRVAQIVEGVDPKVKPSTWLPTDGRTIAEAHATTLAMTLFAKPPEDATLDEVLRQRGWRHQQQPTDTTPGTRVIFNDKGESLGNFTAHEAWVLVKATTRGD